ncbi:signal transducer and activator of transcription 6 isoform X3 [Gouania willdenowi]|uniref:signal transducer and activator of transcription 6 isoform X3 n=1 Tax=Gouania willdenowi TaxID=441366 RepID=UPI0010544FBD|nr:signal transducer and transcription activator 6-like isoform X3 [Gouania willdenowi]
MAQWLQMAQILPTQPDEVSSLYTLNTLPIEVRHYAAAWIESQRWEDFALEKLEQESQAQVLLDQIINVLQLLAQQNTNVVDRMKLMQISRNMSMFQQQPLQFAVIVRDILRREKVLITRYQKILSRDKNQQDVDHLELKVLEVQEIRKQMHQLQEELNWERQNHESLQQGSFQQNGMDPPNTELQRLQKHIQQLEFKVNTMSTNHFQLLKDCVDCLDCCQTGFISKLKAWRCEQHKAAIGLPFDDNLNPLQTWCEQLLAMNGKLRQELMLIGDQTLDLQERLRQLLQTVIESSLVVDKQPPQVIKTQSKFSTTVRYLLGEKVAPGKPVVLKAQIVNELQARNLGGMLGENVAELINNSAILEHNTTSKSTCATFRNMSIKKIKRADRKGTESVTEEKFALLFSTEINITGCDTPYRIQMISQPVVVIVHGSQDNSAVATIIWDCAFSEPDRVPFMVPERVSWRMMYNTLNSKFTSEVQTKHNLDQYHQHFLAQKIFNNCVDDFSNMMVSWFQFNKEVLPGRTFTFWQWFEGVIELTKKHLRTYWSEGLIFGFIGKQHLHLILQNSPNGTFLLRFSDSEIGGITIAYVSATESEYGGQKIQNIQPFTKRDLEIRSLGDRICDIDDIMYLYPACPKHEVFKKYYSEPQVPTTAGYIPVSLQTKVGMDAAPNITPVAGSPHGSFSMEGVQSSNMAALPENSHGGFRVLDFQQSFTSQEMPDNILENPASPPIFNEQIPASNMDIDLDSILETLNSSEEFCSAAKESH